MVSFKELVARIGKYFRFSQQELIGLIVGTLVVGFIFSFRNWGDGGFDLLLGLRNFSVVVLAAGLSLFGRVACQKIYALSIGYQMEFRTWWVGLGIMLVLVFLSAGYLTLVLAGGAWLAFMTRQRLGSFRYGHNYEEQAIVGLWGILGSLIMAGAFRVGDYFLPGVLFFEKGMMISVIFAICTVLPIPRMEGLSIFFGARGIYWLSLAIVLVGTMLLLFGGGLGLLIGIILGLLAAGIAILWGSEI